MICLKVKKNDFLVNYLVNFEGLNYNKVKQLLKQKDIKVNNKRIKEDLFIKIDDEIILYSKENYFFNINKIYEDENILIVDKPKKLEVISTTKNIDLINLINRNYYAVHRLDFNTEGLVVIAKNIESKIEIDNVFKNSKVEKIYITICKNKPKENELTFSDYILKENNISKIFNNNVKNSKKCITKIKLENFKDNYSLLKVNLITGRTHQIRTHLAFHNLFVLGDEKYGDFKINKKLNLNNQILKCISLKFNFDKNSFLNYLNNKNFNTTFENIINFFEKL